MANPSPSSPMSLLDGHPHPVERDGTGVAGVDAQLARDGARGQTGHAPFQQERRDAPVTQRPVDGREHQEVVGDVREADPQLGAIEHVRVAVARGGRGHGRHVGARVRLGQPERGQPLTACLGHQPALLLLLGRPLHERQGVERDVDAHDHPKGGIGSLQLFAQDAQAGVVHARTAPALPDGRAQIAQLGHPVEHLAMHFVGPVPALDVGRDLARHEVAHALLHQQVLGGQGEVDGHRMEDSWRDRSAS